MYVGTLKRNFLRSMPIYPIPTTPPFSHKKKRKRERQTAFHFPSGLKGKFRTLYRRRQYKKKIRCNCSAADFPFDISGMHKIVFLQSRYDETIRKKKTGYDAFM